MEKLSRGIQKVIDYNLVQTFGNYVDVDQDQDKYCVLGGCALATGYINDINLKAISGLNYQMNYEGTNLTSGFGVAGLLRSSYFNFILTGDSFDLLLEHFTKHPTNKVTKTLFTDMCNFFDSDANSIITEFDLIDFAMFLNDFYHKSFEQILEIVKWCEDNLSYYQ